jgi:non-ribosomal peptide synthetase component F
MVLLAVWYVLLHRWSGAEDIVVATPITHRRTETEGVMGRFLNTLALRVDLGGDPSFRELLARVREAALGAYRHKDLPFERLLRELGPAADPSRRPLVQVSFVLQEHVLPPFRLGDLELTPFWVDRGISDFELTLGLSLLPAGGLDGFVEYQTELFHGDDVARLARELLDLAAAAAADPGRRLSQLMRGLGGAAGMREPTPDPPCARPPGTTPEVAGGAGREARAAAADA